MKWNDAGESFCPVAQTSAILGDRWTLLILREAFLGARRFDAFQQRLGVSPHLLSVRLKRLVAEGIFNHDGKKRSEYRLTKAGRALQPILLLLAKWGNEWRSGGAPQMTPVHQACGQPFDPVIRCSACDGVVGLDVETVFGAELLEERAERVTQNSRGRKTHDQ